jgi:hypothetical protein
MAVTFGEEQGNLFVANQAAAFVSCAAPIPGLSIECLKFLIFNKPRLYHIPERNTGKVFKISYNSSV